MTHISFILGAVVYALFLVMLSQVLFSKMDALGNDSEGSAYVSGRRPYESQIRKLLMER